MTYEEVLSRFRVAHVGADKSQCYCPVHGGGNEKNPSLTISRANNGGTVLYCHVCGLEGTPAILDSVGLKWSDVNPQRKKHGKTVKEFAEWPGRKGEYQGARFVESYEYRNQSGYAYTKCRVSLPDGRGKTFRYCRLDSDGLVAEFKVKNRQDYGALYPFSQLQAARNGSGVILYVEGEKDAKNAIQDGFHAVTAGGSNDWSDLITDHFKGLNVIVVPDRDTPGYKSAERISQSLNRCGVNVRVIHWPEDFEVLKGDYSDYIDTFPDRQTGVMAFRKLIESAVTPADYEKECKRLREQDRQQERETIKVSTEDEVSMIARKIHEREGGKIFEVTDSKCGELIGRFFPECRYNVTARQWYWYDGKRWVLDAESMHIERAAAIFEKALWYYSIFYLNDDILPDDKSDFHKACGSLSRRARRVAAIQDARKVNFFDSNELDSNTSLLNCQNGVLNIDTGEFLPHKPEFMLSKIAGAEYRPEVRRNDFPVFVNQIMQDDADKVQFLQTYSGYTASGRPVQECFLILYGATTRNGKGTFCETLMKMFGDYAASIRPESLAVKHNKDGSSASDDIARLAGIRFLNCSEPAKGMHLDEALVKSLTGGDKITARHLFERFFEFYPQFSIMMNVNYLPMITDTTLFSSGRVMVLTFDKHFDESEQDKGLKARLQEPENLSAVLNWVLDGYRRYKSEGLLRPESVINATAEYADDSDKIKRFFIEEMEESPGINARANDVYERYSQWCNGSGLFAEGKQNFFQMLRGRGLLQKAGTVEGVTVRNVVPGYRIPVSLDEVPDKWK